jgi:hypothetical protein
MDGRAHLKRTAGINSLILYMRHLTGPRSGTWRKQMKKRACIVLFTIFAAASTASAQMPGMDAKPAAPAAPAATAPATGSGAAAAATAPAATASHSPHVTHVAPTHKKGWRHWWRNRQIERGPRALRPGHHRRLLRRG